VCTPKAHLSEILGSKGSPTVATFAKLAKVLDLDVLDFFMFPERGQRDRALGLIAQAKPDMVRHVVRLPTAETDQE